MNTTEITTLKQTISESLTQMDHDLDGLVPGWLLPELVESSLKSKGLHVEPVIITQATGPNTQVKKPLAVIDEDFVMFRQASKKTAENKRSHAGEKSLRKWFGIQLQDHYVSISRFRQ